MQLLVSVRDADEARIAVDSGAEIIDAKEPSRGALGAVSSAVLQDIVRAVGQRRTVSAALGDSCDDVGAEHAARAAAAAGAAFVKLGIAGAPDRTRAATVIAGAMSGARSNGAAMIVVGYADWQRAGSIAPRKAIDIAIALGARGVLIDTATKDGPSLRLLASALQLESLASRTRESGLQLALAGKLGVEDVEWARALGADILGVRGAACDGGRSGRVSASRVARLAGLVSGTGHEPNNAAGIASSALTTAVVSPVGSARAK